MTRIYIFSLFLLFSYNSIGQETFTIKNIGSEYSESQIIEAMSSAEWCGYYFSDSKRVLNFNDGTVVELKSAEELTSSDIDFDASCISSSSYTDNNAYSIHSSGRIVITIDKKSELKYKTN